MLEKGECPPCAYIPDKLQQELHTGSVCSKPRWSYGIDAKQDGEAIRRPLRSISQAVIMGGVLAIACFVSYASITHLLGQAYFVSQDDGLFGGMWSSGC
jgi:hypothetical protein